MKLIDADEAFRVLSDYYHHRTETQADALREALGLVPEAVVRCKDCQYAHMSTDGSVKYCDVWFPDEAEYIDGDDYCSYGERKTAESE